MILLTNYLCLPILQKTVEDIGETNESLECPVIDIVYNSDCQDVVETCSSQTQTEPCNSAVSTADKGTQVEQFPMRPYHLYESRKRSDIRTEIINQIRHLLSGYVHGDEDSLATIAQDLIQSKKWATTFGVPEVKQDKCIQDKVLQSIVKEYKECKSKETNSLIRGKGRKLKQAINISGTMSSSSIAFQGTTPDYFKSRTEAARSMGRVVCYSAERRRLLSIVAAEYPQTYLTELFQCSKSTVTAARVHSILFGRGGFPPASLKFTRQCVSQEVLDHLADFLLRDDVSRPSSCRSVLVGGEECPVRYWQDSIKQLIKQYLLEFPNGVKRSYIYAHIPSNYQSNTMLAGLCNLCEDLGFSNFSNLREMVQKLGAESRSDDIGSVRKSITLLQRYLKTKFSDQVLIYIFYNCNFLTCIKKLYQFTHTLLLYQSCPFLDQSRKCPYP